MAAKTLKYFTPDGIRGLENKDKKKILTAELALKVGFVAGIMFRNGGHSKVVIGKATGLPGYMIEPALTAGFAAAGMDVVLLGPLPSPAVAMLVRSLRAALGVMISVSNRSYDEVGIQLFGPDNLKLSDDVEAKIDGLIDTDMSERLAGSSALGRAMRIDSAKDRYIEYVKRNLPDGLKFNGLRVVVDCANGAAYEVGPSALYELGAEVVKVGIEPNGLNINQECGIGVPNLLSHEVHRVRADIGFALDGDGSQVIVMDEKREILSDSAAQAILAKGRQECPKTADLNGSTAKDGLMTALQILAVVKRSGKKVSELVNSLKPKAVKVAA